MNVELWDAVFFSTMRSCTPLLIAGLGVLIAEKSGMLNLGQEGTLVMAAAAGFIIAANTQNYFLAVVSACLVGALMASLFALFTLVVNANQVASGLALSIFGVGLASFIGGDYSGESLTGMQVLPIPLLGELPVLGRGLFAQDALTYCGWFMVPIIIVVLTQTHWGLLIKAVGEDPQAAHALGISVYRVRWACLLMSGALVGLAGAYLSLSYTPIWTEDISAGKGWIVLALVVFSSWQVGRLVLGALLFGFVSVLHLLLQGTALAIPSNLLAMAPYVMTIMVLVWLSWRSPAGSWTPKSLAQNFIPGK